MKRIFAIVLGLALVLSMVTAAFAEERPTLRVAYPGNQHAFLEGEDENNNHIIRYIEENTGIDVEWILLPVEDSRGKLNLMMAAQEVDVVFYGDFQTLLDYNTEGLLLDMAPYIDDAGFAEDTLALTKECTFGETFAIFYPGGQSDTTVVWMYNKPLLDAAGIEVPEDLTLDQWTEILYKIQEAYPDKIPLAAAGQTSSSNLMLKGMDNIYAAYGIANTTRVTDDGSLEFTATTDDMRQCLEFIAKLYADGILDPEYLVSTLDTLVPKIVNEQIVSINAEWYDFTGTYMPYMADEDGEVRDWVQVPIIIGTRETTGQTLGNRHRQLGAITAQCQNVEAAMKLLAFMSTDEYYYRITYGEEGVDSVKNEDGTYTLLDTPLAKAYSTNGTLFHNYYSVKESKELRCMRLRGTYASEDLFNVNIMNFYAPKEVADPIRVHPYTPEYDDILSDLMDTIAVYSAKILTGEYDISAFDDMIAELDGWGLTEGLEALNDWYTAG